jgi:flap endonuclease-1
MICVSPELQQVFITSQMGVHGLLPLLRELCPNAFTPFSMNGHVAVDAPIFMYKFGYLVGTGKPLCTRMLLFGNEIRERGLEPVFVFDGQDLPAKSAEKEKRRAQNIRQQELRMLELSRIVQLSDMEIEVECSAKPSCKPISEDYEAVTACLKEAGFRVVEAKHEAEALCSYMFSLGHVQGVITEDSDTLAYLCGSSILHWKSEKEEVVNAQIAMEYLDLTPPQFIDLCVLLGNDFNDRIKNIGPARALGFLRKYGSLQGILDWGRSWHPSIRDLSKDEEERMWTARKIFQTFCFEVTPESTADPGEPVHRHEESSNN